MPKKTDIIVKAVLREEDELRFTVAWPVEVTDFPIKITSQWAKSNGVVVYRIVNAQ